MSGAGGPEARTSGLAAEELVEKYLQTKGFSPLARNHTCRQGELDLVVEQGPLLVFVEVKKRKAGALVDALSAVTAAKQRKIVRAAEDYVRRHSLDDRPCRFDVVAVTQRKGRPPEFLHLEAAFDASAGDAPDSF